MYINITILRIILVALFLTAGALSMHCRHHEDTIPYETRRVLIKISDTLTIITVIAALVTGIFR